VRTKKRAESGAGGSTGISGKNSGLPNLTPLKPGVSGNPSGRPAGDSLMRKRLMTSFLANEEQAMAAMARRWASTRYVQDMWELLAKLEGELSKDAGENARRVSLTTLNNQGRGRLDPEVFREAARRKVLEERPSSVNRQVRATRPPRLPGGGIVGLQ
jgi:hypothetical protein